MRRIVLLVLVALLLGGATFVHQRVRSLVRAIVRPEPPPQITPLAVSLPPASSQPTTRPTLAPTPTSVATSIAAAETASPVVLPTPTIVPSPTSAPTPTPGPVEVNGRLYDAYIPAATKGQQAYKYSCEFDAAWVVLETYGISANVDEIIEIVGVDTSVEPAIKETGEGFFIYGGDIANHFSGSIDDNFLARGTGSALQKAFVHYDLQVTPVSDRAGVEAALRAGHLVWMKTTVDFKPWRPATWVMPNGDTRPVVLGNDHAVVAMGFSERGVVIRDVLGPTSSNWHRPYEYEVAWDTFLAAWGAQGYDGLAITRPTQQS